MPFLKFYKKKLNWNPRFQFTKVMAHLFNSTGGLPLTFLCCLMRVFRRHKTNTKKMKEPGVMIGQITCPPVLFFRYVRNILSSFTHTWSCIGQVLFAPDSACVFALFQCCFCNEFAVFIVNSYLNLVEIFRSLLAVCVHVGSCLLGYSGLVACGLLR